MSHVTCIASRVSLPRHRGGSCVNGRNHVPGLVLSVRCPGLVYSRVLGPYYSLYLSFSDGFCQVVGFLEGL